MKELINTEFQRKIKLVFKKHEVEFKKLSSRQAQLGWGMRQVFWNGVPSDKTAYDEYQLNRAEKQRIDIACKAHSYLQGILNKHIDGNSGFFDIKDMIAELGEKEVSEACDENYEIAGILKNWKDQLTNL